MTSHSSIVILLCIFLATASPAYILDSFVAYSQETDEIIDQPLIIETAKQAFFHVEINGSVPNAVSGGATPERRLAKAFAISPDTLIVPRHVLGESSDWEKVLLPDSPLARAFQKLDRKIWLTSPSGTIRQDIVVLPGFSDASDAAAIKVPDLGLADFYNISLCGPEKGKKYNALIAGTSPDDPKSVATPTITKLRAEGLRPELYGGLYVFEPTAPAVFSLATAAHEGSPVFDDQSAVIAFISAVDLARDGEGELRVFATPIQPLIPPSLLQLSSYERDSEGDISRFIRHRPRCSIASAISDMTDRVAAYATWEVNPELEGKNPTNNILIRYSGVNDPTDISLLKVEYAFLEEIPSSRQDEARLADVTVDDANRVPSIDKYTFLLDDIVKRACTLLPETLGKIEVVRLSFEPVYINDRVESRPVTRYISWDDLNGERPPNCKEQG